MAESLIKWSDELSVGIQEIDEQHKILVELLNDMHAAIHERRGAEVAQQILDKLFEYTRIHFAVEESLMRILDYPGYEEHKKEHEELINELAELRAKLEREGKHISFELIHFLKMWLTQHILESDMDYGPHFLRKGVKSTWAKESWLSRLWH